MRCASHPNIETPLCCGKCEKPICPQCMVETPVGMRCRECAHVVKSPVRQVSGRYYMRALGVAVLLAVGFGLAWGLLRVVVPFWGFLGFFVSAGAGYGTAELVSRSVRRKRGAGLAAIGGLSVAAAYALGLLFFPSLLVGVAYGVSLWDLLFVAVAVVVSVNMLR